MLARRLRCLLGKRIVHRLFSRIEIGGLSVRFTASGETRVYGDAASPIQGQMDIHDEYLTWRIVTLSELGLGLGYVDGSWTSESPYRVLLVLLLNEEKFRPVVLRGHWLDLKALRAVRDARRRVRNNHVIEHCRRQIGLTYDIGNEFYRWMLGSTVTYSCAVWPHASASLDEAQRYKFDIVIEKLGIEATHRVLDVGCGWGTLVNHIRERTGARVRGIALSHRQIEACRERFPEDEFAYQDYREERGQYDRIVSVGMLEHVGRANIPAFLRQVIDLLRPGGRCLIHYLHPYDKTFVDPRGRSHPSWGTVLMPNAQSPTQAELLRAAMKTGALRLLHTETFALHYARTGAEWLANLHRHAEEIRRSVSPAVAKAHEYAWHLGRAVMETGYGLSQIVFEKRPFGSPYEDSAVDVVRSRAEALADVPLRDREPRRDSGAAAGRV